MAHDHDRGVMRSGTITGGDVGVETALGQVHGYEPNVKFGVNGTIGTTEEDLWEYGGKYVWPQEGDFLELVSTSAEDNPLGLGTWSVHIDGLDSEWNPISEVIELDGLTPVVTLQQFRRVNRMFSQQSTDRIGQVGTISATHVDDAEVLAIFTPTNNQTLQTMYTVPKGYVAVILGTAFGSIRNEQAFFRFWSKDNRNASHTQRVRRTATTYEQYVTEDFRVPFVLDEMTDLWISAVSLAATPVRVTGEYSMLIVDRGHSPRFAGVDPTYL